MQQNTLKSLIVAVTAGACGVASATVLTFDPAAANGVAINDAYGDRVTSATQDGFSYGTMFGPTPNIEVSYGTDNGLPLRWSADFGDLQNVIYAPESGRELRVTMVADADWLVALHGFDAAGWPNTDYTINSVRVIVDGQVAFEELDALIRGATADGEGRRHTSYDFGSPLVGSTVEIVLDVANIGATNQDNIGIDNIGFGQVVIPSPGGAVALAACGLGVLGRRRR